MTDKEVTITNDTGLHSRPADLFVRTAKLYDSRITLFKGEKSADAKNIIKVILLNASQGTVIRIEADGRDEDDALKDLTSLIESGFDNVNTRVTI
ncbi:MAG: HPr family phosphocarrier protein [Bacteroidales bacterium]|nr:HPr family phosphocarrier protein [Bacteroidales bacterium]RKX88000.1 MAG: phosphocarrier protein HPr [Spirochaetota bacterium]RKX95060.1 MAG: phosphocarrier protein HPr [Spirochaetota bacterium]